ncbi:MAG: SIMPL domain-containing protein [Bacteroidales bacterium]|nr:SIMPL domain-containing protein [Bacteroidales bacterium]
MENGTIKVEGRGSIHVVPDVTRLIVTVDSTFSNYADAYARGQENAKWMRQIMTYNKQDANRVKSIKFDISDHYENQYDSNGHYVGQYKDGFELNQKFKVDMGIDPVLLNKLVRGVGKFVLDAQIDIRYTVLDERPIHLKLIERAVKDARAKAQVIVDTAGCALSNIKCIDYGDHGFDVISEARNIHSNAEATACVADSLDIMPDDMSVSDRVSVEFYIA